MERRTRPAQPQNHHGHGHTELPDASDERETAVWVHLLAYNVIRSLMAQAACNAGVAPRGLSIKHTVQLWTEWVSRGLCATKARQRRFTLIAPCRVGHRPGRIEPRRRKRTPKPDPRLKVPRAQARRQVQTHGHAWEPT